MDSREKVEAINNLLPQTQCGECHYSGCLPYAQALEKGEASIDQCPPGGVPTLKALAHYLNEDPTPYIDSMEKRAKTPTKVRIREIDCIGCTKCIKACPVDAIMGSAKQMHQVIQSECTGCELCIAPCPVDCIEIIPLPKQWPTLSPSHSELAKTRYNNRNTRLHRIKQQRLAKHEKAKKPFELQGKTTVQQRKNYMEEALARFKKKKKG